MKHILIIIVTFVLSLSSPAELFQNKEQEQRIQQQEQQLAQERGATGAWQVIAGIAVIGAVVLFTVGTALGSIIRRRHGKSE